MLNEKLNILLVMPRFVRNLGEGYNFPLGIAYISSSLKKAGNNIFTLNLNHEQGKVQDILDKEIKEHNINILMTGCLSFQYISVKNIIESAKQIKPSITTIVGGGIITAEPEISMKALEFADIGIIGEGEETSCDLINAIANNIDKEKINGIIFKKDDVYITTAPRKEIKDLDILPLPDYEGFNIGKYLNLPPMSLNNVLTNRAFFVVGSRSCPYQCTFCFHTSGKIYRQRSMDKVLQEIKYLKDNYNIQFIKMSDELFGRKKDRIKEFARQMKEWNLKWTAFFRIDDVDDELINIIKSSTCCSMDFGIESADNNVLKSMKKHITIEQIEKTLKLVYDAGIPTTGSFIFGDIEETLDSALKTINWWQSHRQYSIGLNFISTYPGTFIYKYACENGIIKDRVKFLKDGCPQINISKMSKSELSILSKTLLELTYKGEKIENLKMVEQKKRGRAIIEGRCVKCKEHNVWDNVKFFIGGNWVTCKKCGQQYVPELPDNLKNNLLNNIINLLKENKKIALWGITPHSIGLFEKEKIFKDENIVFVDNAYAKQLIKLQNKTVCDLEILKNNEIETIIFFYPNSLEIISTQILELYPNIKKIIDVCDLLEEGAIA